MDKLIFFSRVLNFIEPIEDTPALQRIHELSRRL